LQQKCNPARVAVASPVAAIRKLGWLNAHLVVRQCILKAHMHAYANISEISEVHEAAQAQRNTVATLAASNVGVDMKLAEFTCPVTVPV